MPIATDTPSLACEVEAHIRRREFRSADVRVRGNEVLIDKDGNSWSPTFIPFTNLISTIVCTKAGVYWDPCLLMRHILVAASYATFHLVSMDL